MTRPFRLLYVMHVDWRWIKQRPHYLAEGLVRQGDRMSLFVVYLPAILRQRLTRNRSSVRRLPLPALAGGRYTLVQPLNNAFGKLALTGLAAVWPPDAVWLTAPELFAYLPASLRRRPLVYDAMDVVSPADPDATRRTRSERETLRHAAVVFASSERIAERLASLAVGPTPVIVRNGFDGTILDPPQPRPAGASFRLGYVGTIGHWLDIAALRHVLNRFPTLEIHLIGPVIGEPVAHHDRLHVHKPVDHTELQETVAHLDATILPFCLDELTLGVDPVKLYEYIAWRRPVVAVRYSEISYAEPFVTFYRGVDELTERLARLMDRPSDFVPPLEAARAFLAHSTWHTRLDTVRAVLRDKLSAPLADEML